MTLRFPDEKTLSITRCYPSQANVRLYITGALTVRDLHVTEALPCPSGPPGTQQQNDFIDSVLHGDLTWSVTGDRLTVSRGSDSLVFRRRA